MIRVYVAIAVVLVLSLLIGQQRFTIIGLRTDVKELKAERDGLKHDLEQAQANEATTEAALNICNMAVDRLKEEGDEAAAAGTEEVERVRRNNMTLQTRINVLLTAPRPVGLNACQNAERIIDDEIGRIIAAGAGGVR